MGAVRHCAALCCGYAGQTAHVLHALLVLLYKAGLHVVRVSGTFNSQSGLVPLSKIDHAGDDDRKHVDF